MAARPVTSGRDGALVLVGVAVVLVVAHTGIRAGEAALLRLVFWLLGWGPTSATGDTVYFGLGTADAAGLRITSVASVLSLLVPWLLVLAATMAWSRMDIRMLRIAAARAAALIVVASQVRLLVAAALIRLWGHESTGFARIVSWLLLTAATVLALVALLLAAGEVPRERQRGYRDAT
ncbi:hypothetical protein ABZ863_17565 [Saccharomonospora sp. NPDC046836]|uniref:hypothetical protein n=1 Tax=Saccharomonospora sp. NPDC046836 TaxID=3156921 RepID=UPI0034119D27